MVPVAVRLVAVALGAVVAAGCARRPAPVDPGARALFRDLERQVTVAATTGWSVDRLEVEELAEGAVDSACRVAPPVRHALRDWLAAEIARLGGPVELAWRARGKKLTAVSDLLVVTRIQRLLARAEELAAECPFWLEPEQPFRGRQVSERRWQFSFGGGGKGIVVARDDRVDLSFGGGGRFLIGRAFGAGHALSTGIELGASASFPKDGSGERTALVLGVDLVAPVVYRYTLTNTYVELESGWLGRTNEQDWGDFDHGVHVGAAVGARALRTRFVFPGAAFGVSYERTFGDDVTLLKVGARVVFDLDL